jgi:hypothetical protein
MEKKFVALVELVEKGGMCVCVHVNAYVLMSILVGSCLA